MFDRHFDYFGFGPLSISYKISKQHQKKKHSNDGEKKSVCASERVRASMFPFYLNLISIQRNDDSIWLLRYLLVNVQCYSTICLFNY